MDVSIIIVNYNTKDLIKTCIDSIYGQTDQIKFEIIVVDNASKDGSQQMIKNEFPNVILIESPENMGFGKANNFGAKHASGKYLLFLNSDTILLNNAVRYFFDFSEQNNAYKIGALGSILLDIDNNPTHSYNSFPTMTGILKAIIRGYLYKNRKNDTPITLAVAENLPKSVDYITGADLFLTKDLFIKVNGFDPSFFLYFEETDLQKKFQNQGYQNMIIEGPLIIHLEGGSDLSPQFSLRKRAIYTKSTFHYFKNNSNFVSFYIFRLAYFIIRLPILFDRKILLRDRLKYIYSIIDNSYEKNF